MARRVKTVKWSWLGGPKNWSGFPATWAFMDIDISMAGLGNLIRAEFPRRERSWAWTWRELELNCGFSFVPCLQQFPAKMATSRRTTITTTIIIAVDMAGTTTTVTKFHTTATIRRNTWTDSNRMAIYPLTRQIADMEVSYFIFQLISMPNLTLK